MARLTISYGVSNVLRTRVLTWNAWCLKPEPGIQRGMPLTAGALFSTVATILGTEKEGTHG